MSDPIDARLAHARSVSEQMRNLVDRKKALLDEARLSPDPQAVRTAVDSLRTLNEHARRLRPHWRNQACGAGRAERRRKWIEPFWKGPAGAEAWSHLYTAEDGKDEKEGA